MMILWVALLMSPCCLRLTGAAAGSAAGLERIERGGLRCSQGLRCKTKPHALFPRPCQTPHEGLNTSSVFHNVSLSTVMRCEGRQKCSLHLRVKIKMQLMESIRGVSICTVTVGMMERCQNVSFKKASRERMSGRQVDVESDGTEISPSQRVKVRVSTVPGYCGLTWTGTHEAPECNSEDLQTHVPECITGRLSYDVNPQKKQLIVGVSDMLEDHDYHLRLCRKDFICFGTGFHALIKRDDPVRSVALPYARPLPCLCIEGWSDTSDAPRVQVCPFKDRVEELWFGVTFDPLEGTLSWQPACPVTAVVALCQRREEACVDLPHASRNVSREKITFTKVDPHPLLCIKFTAGSQSWTKCPFADARFQAWDLVPSRREGHGDAKMFSQISAAFSVQLCVKSEGSPVCLVTQTHTVHVEKHKAVGLNVGGQLCDSCLQVTRLDVKFAPTVVYCLGRCNDSSLLRPVTSDRASWDLTRVVVPAGVFLCGIMIVSLLFHLRFTACTRRKPTMNGRTSEPPTGLDFAVHALRTKPVLHGGVITPDSPQRGNTEDL